MKKYILLAFLMCLSFHFLQAQSFKYGVKAGLNVNNLAISPKLDWPHPTSRLGLHLGGFAQFDLGSNFSIQPELTLSTQGANDEDKDDWQRVKLTYLNLAGVFKYTLQNNLYFSVGPQLGFLTGGRFEEEDKDDGDIKPHKASQLVSGTDLSLGFGIGYKLDSGIDFSLRYNHGLTNINDDPADWGFYKPHQSIQSRVFQISVGYIFNN